MPAKDPCWRFFEERPDPAAHPNKPWVLSRFPTAGRKEGDRFRDDALAATKFLAFHCPEFAKAEPKARIQFLQTFADKDCTRYKKLNKDELAVMTKDLAAAAKGTKEGGQFSSPSAVASTGGGGSGGGNVIDLEEGGGAAGTPSVLVHGLASYERYMHNAGSTPLDGAMIRMTSAQIDAANLLLFRWVVVANLPLSSIDNKAFREWLMTVNPVYAQKVLTYSMIKHRKLIDRIFEETRAAVECIIKITRVVFAAIDGWTDDKGQCLVNMVLIVNGLPFWELPASRVRGVAHTAQFYFDASAPTRSREKNRGVVCDSPSVMISLRQMWMNATMKRDVVVACHFHGPDLIAAGVLGFGGQADEAFVIPLLNVHGTVENSLLVWCKEVDKYFHGMKGAPRDVYNIVMEEMNILHKEDGSKPSATSLASMGDTRKTSAAELMMRNATNQATLEKAFCHPLNQEYLGRQTLAEKARLGFLSKVQNKEHMKKVMIYAKLIGEVKMLQRVLGYRGKNMTDAVFDCVESYERIKEYSARFGGEVPDADVAKLIQCFTNRFNQYILTPNAALAIMLDPRTRFGHNLPGVVKARFDRMGFDLVHNATEALKQRIEHLSHQDQMIIRAQFEDLKSDWRRGGLDERDFDDVHDIHPAEWMWNHRKAGLMKLIEIVAIPILSVPIVADGVEQGNSTFKWVQLGRVRLSSSNAAKLVYTIVNQRLIQQYNDSMKAGRKTGAFKLLHWWPSKLREMGAPITQVEEEENAATVKENARVQQLVDALEEAEEAEEAQAVRGPSRGTRSAEKKRKATAAATDEPQGGDARRELNF
jgi:hypothetical protein